MFEVMSMLLNLMERGELSAGDESEVDLGKVRNLLVDALGEDKLEDISEELLLPLYIDSARTYNSSTAGTQVEKDAGNIQAADLDVNNKKDFKAHMQRIHDGSTLPMKLPHYKCIWSDSSGNKHVTVILITTCGSFANRSLDAYIEPSGYTVRVVHQWPAVAKDARSFNYGGLFKSDSARSTALRATLSKLSSKTREIVSEQIISLPFQVDGYFYVDNKKSWKSIGADYVLVETQVEKFFVIELIKTTTARHVDAVPRHFVSSVKTADKDK